MGRNMKYAQTKQVVHDLLKSGVTSLGDYDQFAVLRGDFAQTTPGLVAVVKFLLRGDLHVNLSESVRPQEIIQFREVRSKR